MVSRMCLRERGCVALTTLREKFRATYHTPIVLDDAAIGA